MKRAAICLLCVMLTGCAIPDRLQDTAAPVQTTASTETLPPTEALTAPAEPAKSTEAPTEPTEPVQPTEAPAEPADDVLVRVIDYIPSVRQELAYATDQNFTGQRIYDFINAYLRYGTVKKLARVCEELAEQGLGLLIWDGFRPVDAQAAIWEICPDPAYVSHPVTGSRSHCRGSAVDVTLVDLETGALLEMPTGFDDFTAYADRDYADCGPEAAANAVLLEEVMKKHGFKPYSAEWWHFSDTDEYPVDEEFHPPVTIITGGVG